VIQVQVGAEDDVDRLGRIAGFGQSLQERELEVIPALVVAVLVVADTGVDDDPSPLRFNDERLDRVADCSVRIRVMRMQPRDRLDAFLGQPCEHEAGREAADLKFDYPGDSDVSDCPTVYCVAQRRSPVLLF
jgi:hypothetical protein